MEIKCLTSNKIWECLTGRESLGPLVQSSPLQAAGRVKSMLHLEESTEGLLHICKFSDICSCICMHGFTCITLEPVPEDCVTMKESDQG